ncbi:MAG: type VI secretion system protein ImpE, partial [Pseudohongiellaceae bacterium]
MSASKFFKEGDLEQAIQACIEDVKEDPANANQRVFFAELLCFSGDYDRADRQLNTLLTLDPKTMLTVSVWRQLLRAAQIRQDVYECKQVPELMDAATPRIENALRALTIANKDNVLPESVAEQEGASEPVVVNGISSSHFRDLDDINANILEVMASNGRYFWIDFDQIDSLEFYAPERPLDLL